jgi:hypothetical protein
MILEVRIVKELWAHFVEVRILKGLGSEHVHLCCFVVSTLSWYFARV